MFLYSFLALLGTPRAFQDHFLTELYFASNFFKENQDASKIISYICLCLHSEHAFRERCGERLEEKDT